MTTTSSTTQFRRYAGDSVKFEDAKPGTLAQIQTGDQLRVRGAKSEDGSSIQAEEIVSGSFKNLAGTIATIDAAAGYADAEGSGDEEDGDGDDYGELECADAAAAGCGDVCGEGQRRRCRGCRCERWYAERGILRRPEVQRRCRRKEHGRAAWARESAGGDLSQLVGRLPNKTIADLKVGDAVMIVASQPDPGSATVTAVTLLSGVEPILAATPVVDLR